MAGHPGSPGGYRPQLPERVFSFGVETSADTLLHRLDSARRQQGELVAAEAEPAIDPCARGMTDRRGQ
jgi:hypothetical protein